MQVTTLRGTGGNLVICEEMAFMDVQVIYQVVFPTLVRTNVAFIGISSMSDPWGAFAKLIEMRYPDGRPVMNTITFKGSCDRCIESGRAGKCTHNMGSLPYWQDKRQHAKLELLMSDQVELFLRESKNVQSDPNVQPALPVAAIEELKAPNPDRIFGDNQFFDKVFISIDPAAGGSGSRYAICSAVYYREKMIVSGRPRSRSAAQRSGPLAISATSLRRCWRRAAAPMTAA